MLSNLNKFYNFQSFPYGIAILNKNLDFLFINIKMTDMFGYSEEEMINDISFEDLFDRDNPLEIDLISNKSLSENLYLEQDFRTKTGEILSIGLQIVPVNITKKKLLKKDAYRIIVFQNMVNFAEAKINGIDYFSHLAKNKLALCVYTLGKLGPELYLTLNADIFERHDELLIKTGIYIFTSIGQGLEHSTGLYGPLPVPESDYLSIVYALDIPDNRQKDLRQIGKRYTILALYYPPFLEYLFTDRRRVKSTLQKQFDHIKDIEEITENLLKKTLNELLNIKEISKREIDLEKKFLAAYNIGRILTKTTDLKSAFDSIAIFCKEILNYRVFGIILINKVSGFLEILTSRGYKAPVPIKGFKLSVNSKKSIVARVARTGRPINIPNNKNIPYYLKITDIPLKSELAVPIYSGSSDEVLGVINVESEIEGAYDADDEMLLSIVAETATGILQRYKKEIQLESLHNLSEKLSRIYDLQESFEEIANFAEKMLNFKIFGALILDEEAKELKFLSHRGYNWKKLGDIPKISTNSNKFFVSHVLQTKKPLYREDLSSQINTPYFKVQEDVIAEYATPLMDQGKVIGVLNIESNKPISKDELLLLDILSHHATIILRLYAKTANKTSDIKKSQEKLQKIRKSRKRKR
ncbi:MAG: hypothetical protein HeimC3_29980 [Candidatus Heimdallarchaeota archaeon LC_3]|nr:MAG: hypothetical protein HeimC3_29980 [Candidatus Heimdallarchaeota archaeon LC_3]